MRPVLFAFVAWFALPAPVAMGQTPVADLSSAFSAADNDDWDRASTLANAHGESARDVMMWTRLRAGKGTFAEAEEFLSRHPNWPGLDRLRARAEESMPSNLPPNRVLAYFGDADPQSGEGTVQLVNALRANGQSGDADAQAIEVWLTYALTDSGHDAMMAAFPDVLAPHHAARADMLLWRWKVAEARRMLPLLSADQTALVEARIALIQNNADRQAKLDAVPAALRDSPGLLYDRYNWLANRGERTAAINILMGQTLRADTLQEPRRWAGWRRSLARWVLREGDPERAYLMASNHFLTEGSAFSDLEWLAGYIALRHLNRPDIALLHFQTMRRNVTSPISVGRAEYWIGRTYLAKSDPIQAQSAFERAAEHQTSFYGLLAAEHLGLSLNPNLAATHASPAWRGSDLQQNDLVRAGLTLLKSDERGKAVLFFAQLGRELNADQIGTLGAHLGDLDEVYFQILLGKSAAERGIIIPELYFPMHPMNNMDLPVDPALALSIARRESEFRTDAGSAVGALGLMQLMPATAQEVAGELDLSFSRNRLVTDWEYNATLGSKYLANLIDMFGDSPVMVAAGYNAGPSRPRQWMDQRGDPRAGTADVVDWIESIPFRETRNYVMRVTESIPIYEARLSGESHPIRFTALLTGVKPTIRPRARPILAEPDGVQDPQTRPQIRSAPATDVTPTLRPVARPNG
ncbi:lytic transglycosylase domain-containing protein [Aestuariibius sp. HNIBRBA575]|uniref:lytic transglycosylase domain-containing protein n=1 Tax=Aestuariibius sp. HNIBRBA575 TaxID=3233343 RepID=UPI0034A2C274